MALCRSMAACLIVMLGNPVALGPGLAPVEPGHELRGDWPRVRPLTRRKRSSCSPNRTWPTRRSWSNCGRWPRLRSSTSA